MDEGVSSSGTNSGTSSSSSSSSCHHQNKKCKTDHHHHHHHQIKITCNHCGGVSTPSMSSSPGSSSGDQVNNGPLSSNGKSTVVSPSTSSALNQTPSTPSFLNQTVLSKTLENNDSDNQVSNNQPSPSTSSQEVERYPLTRSRLLPNVDRLLKITLRNYKDGDDDLEDPADILKRQNEDLARVIHNLKMTNCELTQKVDLLVSQKQLLVKLGEQRDKLNFQLKKQNQHLHYVRLKLRNKPDTRGDSGSSTRNPLLQDVVICSLFNYVTRPIDLKVSRLVCRKWNQYAVPHIRKKITRTFLGHEISKLPSFIDTMERSKDYPIVKYQVGGFPLRNHYKSSFEKFLSVCGGFLVSLNLKLDSLSTFELEEFLIPSVRNLEHFAIVMPTEIPSQHQQQQFPPMRAVNAANPLLLDDIPDVNVDGVPNQHVPLLQKVRRLEIMEVKGTRVDVAAREKFISCIFSHVSNLKTVDIRTGYVDTITTVLNFGLSNFQLSVRELFLDCPIGEKDLKTLTDLKINLSALRLGYFCDDIVEETLEKFIWSQRKSLETCCLSDYVGNGIAGFPAGAPAGAPRLKGIAIHFTGGSNNNNTEGADHMERLKTLEVVQPTGSTRPRQIKFGSGLFTHLKHLKRLVLRYRTGGDNGEPIDLSDVFKIPSPEEENVHIIPLPVEDLELPRTFKMAENMKCISATFPHLKKLRMEDPSDCALQALFSDVMLSQTLTTLVLKLNESNSNADTIVTGIPQDICINLKVSPPGYMSPSNADTSGKDNFARIVKTKNGIVDLPNLIHLELICSVTRPLTDVGVYFGLMYLQQLQEVNVVNCEVSDDIYDVLHKNIPCVHLESVPKPEETEASNSPGGSSNGSGGAQPVVASVPD